jgi:hypothetical protein
MVSDMLFVDFSVREHGFRDGQARGGRQLKLVRRLNLDMLVGKDIELLFKYGRPPTRRYDAM